MLSPVLRAAGGGCRFVEQIDSVLAACTSPSLRRALFTATLPESVEELARTVMQAPIRITVGQRNGASETVRDRLCTRRTTRLRGASVGASSRV